MGLHGQRLMGGIDQELAWVGIIDDEGLGV